MILRLINCVAGPKSFATASLEDVEFGGSQCLVTRQISHDRPLIPLPIFSSALPIMTIKDRASIHDRPKDIEAAPTLAIGKATSSSASARVNAGVILRLPGSARRQSWCCHKESTWARHRKTRMPSRGRRRTPWSFPPDRPPRSWRPSAASGKQKSGSCTPRRR